MSNRIEELLVELAREIAEGITLRLTKTEAEALQDMLSIEWGNEEENEYADKFHKELDAQLGGE